MAGQTGRNILVAYKVESTFGTPPGVVTGASQFRLNAGAGLHLGRATIAPNEILSNGQSAMARLGARSVNGTLSADLSQGTFDALFEAVLRGTWATGTLLPGTTPTRRSFTFEQYLQDNDTTDQFTGCRVSSMKITMAPGAMATVEFGIVGANMAVLSGAAAPFFTTPTLSTTLGMVAVDAAITLAGTSVLDLTGCDFTLDLRAQTQPVIGSTISPDVYDNQMGISGTITALRTSTTRQAAFLAETEMALVLALGVPSPGTASITFTLPRIKFTDFSAALGADGPMIATLPFMAAYDSVTGGMIKIQTTT